MADQGADDAEAGRDGEPSKKHRLHGGRVVVSFATSVVAVSLFAQAALAGGLIFGGLSAFLAVVAARYSHLGFRLAFRDDPFQPGVALMTKKPRVYPVDPSMVNLYTTALLFPQVVKMRIKDRISPATRALSVETEYSLQLPSSVAGATVPVPLLVLKKGTLLDDVTFTGPDGAPCPSLNFVESTAIAAAVLRSLIHEAGQEDKYRRELEMDVLEMLRSPAPVGAASVHAAGELVGRLAGLVDTSKSGRLAVAMVNRLIYHYAVIIQVSNSERWTVVRSNERQLLPTSTPKFHIKWPFAFLLDRLRKTFGVRPNRFILPLQRASLCQSYHLEFMGPHGTYLARQRLIGLGVDSSTYCRLRARFGQRYAHLYMRGAPSREPIHARLELSFFERPPGSLGAAAIASLTLAALVLVGGRISETPGSPRGDLLAVLLAVPGAAAAWVGLDRPGGAFGGTLAARMSAFATLFLALLGGAQYLKALPDPFTPGDLALLGTSDGWAFLSGAALLNLFWISYAWLRRSVLYTALLARDDPHSHQFREGDG